MTYFLWQHVCLFKMNELRSADNRHFLRSFLWWHHRLLVLVLFHGLKINDQWERKIQQVSCVYASGFLFDRKLVKKAILNTKWSFDSAFVMTGVRKSSEKYEEIFNSLKTTRISIFSGWIYKWSELTNFQLHETFIQNHAIEVLHFIYQRWSDAIF